MAFGGILPISSKHKNASWSLRRMLRSREKVLIVLALLTFLIVCIGPIFFLPDLRGGLNNRVDNVFKVYKQMQQVGPELILPPPPPLDKMDGGHNSPYRGIHNNAIDDLHHDDLERLKAKMENDDDLKNVRVIEKPLILSQTTKSTKENVLLENFHQLSGGPLIQGGEDSDPIARERRDKVKEVSLLIIVIIHFY